MGAKPEPEEKWLDCGVFDPEAIAKLVNELAVRGAPMRHMQRRRGGGRAVHDGYVVSATIDGGRLLGIIERDG